jgi:hypothetical protein
VSSFDYANSGLPSSVPKLRGGQATLSAASPGNYSSSLLIEELSAPSGSQPRSVTLIGPSLPFMGTKWGGGNSIKTTWYPGNGDEASQQNLGPKEIPKEWKGEWNRTLMGKSPARASDDQGGSQTIVVPQILVEFLEDMLRGGQRLRVTWTVSSDDSDNRGKIVREGRASEWEFNYTRIQDVEWMVQFEWQSRGQRVQQTSAAALGALSAAAAQMALSLANMASVAAAQPFIAENQTIPLSASNITLGQLENFASAPATLVQDLGLSFQKIETDLQQVVNIASTIGSQPQQVVSSAVNIAKNAIIVANQSVDQIGQTPWEVTSQSTGVADLARSSKYLFQSSDAAQQAARDANTLVLQMQARSPTPAGAGVLNPQSATARPGDLVAVYVTKDGDTPQRVSMRFYNSPDHAVDILQANRMPWGQPSFARGLILMIPALRGQQQLV